MFSKREIFGLSVGWFIGIVLFVLGVVLAVFVWQQFEGEIYTRDFQNVKHSQGYVEATNTQVRGLITEYYKAETGSLEYAQSDPVTAASYRGQMESYLDQIWGLANTIDQSERGEDVQRFLNEHPNQ